MLRYALVSITTSSAGLVAALLLGPAAAQDAFSHDAEGYRSLVSRYCLDCHNEAEVAGGLRLERRDMTDLAADAAIWERVIMKLRGSMMPRSVSRVPRSRPTTHFASGSRTGSTPRPRATRTQAAPGSIA